MLVLPKDANLLIDSQDSKVSSVLWAAKQNECFVTFVKQIPCLKTFFSY